MEENANQKWVREFYTKLVRYLKSEGIEITLANGDRIVEATMRPRMLEKLAGMGIFPCLDSGGRACHESIPDEKLCCLVCACPNYINKVVEGGCEIESRGGKWFPNPNTPTGFIWDCTDCGFGHSKEYVKRWVAINIEYLKSFESQV